VGGKRGSRERLRAEFLKGKVCEWCGSGETLTVQHRQQIPPYIQHLREATLALLEAKVTEGEFKFQEEEARSCPACGSRSLASRKVKRPHYRCLNCRAEFDEPERRMIPTGRLCRAEWKLFWERYARQIKQGVLDERKRLHEEAERFENCIVLCRRCQFARYRGLALCPACRKGYRRPGNEMCWNCFSKTERGAEVAKRYEVVTIKHSWCGNEFKVERQFVEIASDPGVVCAELCELGPESCEIAKSRLGEAGPDST